MARHADGRSGYAPEEDGGANAGLFYDEDGYEEPLYGADHDTDDGLESSPDSASSVGGAVWTALKWWTLVYVVLTHCFVVWKWDSYHSSAAAARITTIVDPPSPAVGSAAGRDEADANVADDEPGYLLEDPSDRFVEDLRKVEDRYAEYISNQQRTVSSLQQLRTHFYDLDAPVQQLRESVSRSVLVNAPYPRREVSIEHIRILLGQVSLTDLDDTEATMTGALRELDELARSPSDQEGRQDPYHRTADTVPWNDVQLAVDDYVARPVSDGEIRRPDRRIRQPLQYDCPLSPTDLYLVRYRLERAHKKKLLQLERSAAVTAASLARRQQALAAAAAAAQRPAIPQDAATKDDLEAAVATVRAHIQKRPSALTLAHLVLPSTLERIDAEWDEQVEELERLLENEIEALRQRLNEALDARIAQMKAEASSATADADFQNCFNEELLEDMVYSGMDAIYRKEDLREVLQRFVQRLPTSSSVILDADLPLPVPPELVSNRSADTANLRRVLDTELLQRSRVWVDRLVELVGGYSNSLDQMLDSIAPGNQRVGDIVVDAILDRAGEVDVPTVKSLAERVKSATKKR